MKDPAMVRITVEKLMFEFLYKELKNNHLLHSY